MELETNNEMLEEFFENMTLGIIFLDENDEILKVNKAVEGFFQKKIGNYMDIPEKLDSLIKTRESFERKVITFKGRIMYVMQKVLLKHNEFKGTIILIQDVTKSQLEEDLKIKEVQQEREILARLISHEVRNSLNLIQGFGQLMKESNDIEFIKKNLKIIFDETSRMSRFVNDVLNFTKEEELSIEEFNVLEVLNDILLFTENSDVIELVSSEDEVFLEGDKDKLKQVFLNLINNGLSAIQFLDKKIFKIIITEFDEKVEIEFVTSYDKNKEIKTDKLFKPYFTTKHKGSGLGLSISRKILKQHKGEIFAFKNDYYGLTFKIILKRGKKYKIVEKSDEL